MAWPGHDSLTVACVSQWRGPWSGGGRRSKPDSKPEGCSGGGRRFAHPYLLTHHVQDGLLPLKQTVRHLLEPPSTHQSRR